ncbi:MAG: DUF4038 domain-containing protein [Bryobacteraceae bacterium]|jgi:hypothetical protein
MNAIFAAPVPARQRHKLPWAGAAAAIGVFLIVAAQPAAGVLRVSSNGRYFVDSATGAPFFWLGNTQWALFRGFTIDEARTTIDSVKRQGYTVLATMLAGGTDATVPNLEGQTIWLNNDPSTPNEAYFKRVDAIVSYAVQRGLIVRIGMLHNSQLQYMSNGRGRAYAKFVATRYKDLPNIIWSLHGNVDNPALISMVREMAQAIREADGGAHLISQKPDPAPRSSGIIQNEPWLDFTESQTFKNIDLIYPMVTADYGRTPAKPTVMDEGAYEGGTEYGFPVTPLLVRRQAYYSYLSGGSYTYGHNDSWRILPTWRAALAAPGANQVGYARNIFESLPEWWFLTPDQSVLAAGANSSGDVLYLGARHKDGKWAMVYCAAPHTFSVAMSRLSGKARAYWVDPRTGKSTPAGSYANRGARSFTTPTGWEDALLLMVTGKGKRKF